MSLALRWILILPRSEVQMFNEVWRLYRDYFWDAGMAGVDWVKAREQYASVLPKISDSAGFTELISYLIAELGAGHTAVGVPDSVATTRISVGKLGGDFVDDDGVRVEEVYDGDLDLMEERSPLSRATLQLTQETASPMSTKRRSRMRACWLGFFPRRSVRPFLLLLEGPMGG